MYDKLTKKDIEKMEQEIEHRKLVVRKEREFDTFFNKKYPLG